MIFGLGIPFASGGQLLLGLARRTEERRLVAERTRRASQRKFTDTMLLSQSEREARELLSRHLERSLPGVTAIVLSQKEGDSRLEATPPQEDASVLGRQLAATEQPQCLAVRSGALRRETRANRPLQINDQYGHAVGDDVLAAVGELVGTVVRESDFAARYGGEEFIALLPDPSTEGALVLADKLRGAITRLTVTGASLRISASFGIAAFPIDAVDGESLVRAADGALYEAKAAGRNRVVAGRQSDVFSTPAGIG